VMVYDARTQEDGGRAEMILYSISLICSIIHRPQLSGEMGAPQDCQGEGEQAYSQERRGRR
jgi:hypothetical protein